MILNFRFKISDLRFTILGIFFILFIATGISLAQEKNVTDNQGPKDGDFNAQEIIENNKAALVSIWYHTSDNYNYYTYTNRDTTLLNGSGFIFRADGLIGTNFHVVERIDSLIVKTSDGNFYYAQIVLIDEKNDFAILKIVSEDSLNFQTINFGNSDDVKQGQDVYAIGSPLGFEYTISQGIVAAIRSNEKVDFTDPITYMPVVKTFEKVIQITAAISPGNSGGALFNSKGEVIGITTYTYMGYGNLNFAVAINAFKRTAALIGTGNIADNEELKAKKEESLFNSNYRIAGNLKSQLSYEWYYSKWKDTMKVIDTFAVRKDSANRINLAKAESYYFKCIEMHPDTFYVYRDLLDLYVMTDSYTKAEDLFKTVRERFTSDSLVNSLSSSLASAYSSSKDYKKALTFYEKMQRADTSDNFIRYSIANIYDLMGDYKKAEKSYKEVIGRDSSNTSAYVGLGKIYYEKYKDYDKAKKILENAYDREMTLYGTTPYNIDLLYYLGMIAVKEGRKFDAILAYMDLKSVYGSGIDDNKKKADLYKAIKNLDE
ncbi:MAG: trypsin-like peptidase domain-containing protein [Bacteroidetes bacterium]|nr:trypsin-like peptidase domain-containing protein [Bacteroidota bacterium]